MIAHRLLDGSARASTELKQLLGNQADAVLGLPPEPGHCIYI